jgi:hypothetical protein
MTPTERLLTIFRLAGKKGERGVKVANSTRIREQMGDVYEGTAGTRKWRRDIRTLRDRGLIESDLSTPRTPNRTGIRLRVPPKPDRLHLTADEHETINRARQALRPGISAVSPLGATGADRYDIDHVTRILRFLEENEDEVELAELSRWLELSESRVVELVDLLAKESAVTGGPVEFVEFGYDADGDGTGEFPATVRVIRGRVRGQSPTRGRGMDELGFFPYSLAETEDRLSLIDEALNADVMDGDEREGLSSARQKLLEWRGHLPGGAAMS